MTTKTNPPAPQTHRGDFKVEQLNIRVSGNLKTQFAEQCRLHRYSQAEVIETLIEAWVTHAQDVEIRHLDGSLCPVSAMIKGLADATRHHLSATKQQKGEST